MYISEDGTAMRACLDPISSSGSRPFRVSAHFTLVRADQDLLVARTRCLHHAPIYFQLPLSPLSPPIGSLTWPFRCNATSDSKTFPAPASAPEIRSPHRPLHAHYIALPFLLSSVNYSRKLCNDAAASSTARRQINNTLDLGKPQHNGYVPHLFA